MSSLQPWMPEDALGGPQVARPIAQVVSDWARAWFAQAQWNSADFWVRETELRDGWTTLRDDTTIALRGRPGAILGTAFSMLGEEERPNLTTRDLRLLRRIAGEALDDLVDRLKADLPARGANDHHEMERWSLALALGGEPMLELSLDRTDLCLLARRTFAPAPCLAGLEPAAAAVAEVPVPISGQIGRASLAIDQIGALEPGDILVLDHEAEDPIELVVAGARSSLRCSLTDVGGALGLKVCEPQ